VPGLEASCSRRVVFVAFVLFAKKYVRDGRRVRWMLAVSADRGYVDSSVASNPHGHAPYFGKDEAIVFTLR
jgi:hypothetical protein